MYSMHFTSGFSVVSKKTLLYLFDFIIIDYLSDISEMLLYLLLPPEDFHNKPFRYFFRVSASIIYLFSISVQGLYSHMTSWINVVHSGAEPL